MYPEICVCVSSCHAPPPPNVVVFMGNVDAFAMTEANVCRTINAEGTHVKQVHFVYVNFNFLKLGPVLRIKYLPHCQTIQALKHLCIYSRKSHMTYVHL